MFFEDSLQNGLMIIKRNLQGKTKSSTSGPPTNKGNTLFKIHPQAAPYTHTQAKAMKEQAFGKSSTNGPAAKDGVKAA